MRAVDRPITRPSARSPRLVGLLIALALAPSVALAHPHVYIDGGVDFLFDGQGRLDRLRVTWIYDPLSSLFMFEDLNISPDEAENLGSDDLARLAAYQTRWDPGFEGDSYLWDGPRRVGLSGPVDATARVRDGKVEISFLRELEAPFRPGPEMNPDDATTTVTRVYDPSYYTDYSVTDPPRLEGARNCRAKVVPFKPNGPLAALQETLAAIPIDGDPEGGPGALLADRILVACD